MPNFYEYVVKPLNYLKNKDFFMVFFYYQVMLGTKTMSLRKVEILKKYFKLGNRVGGKNAVKEISVK